MIDAALAALAKARAGQAAHLQRHQPFGGEAYHLAQEFGIGSLLQKAAQGHRVVGHRGGSQVSGCKVSTTQTLPKTTAVAARAVPLRFTTRFATRPLSDR